MICADLKTAAEVRAHAREVQHKINERRAAAPPEPPPIKKTPPRPARDDVVPDPAHTDGELPQLSKEPRLDSSSGRTRAALTITAVHFGLTLENLQMKGGGQQLTLPRQIACFVAKRLGVSYSKIGFMAQRDHTTVLYSCQLVRRHIPRDPSLARLVDLIGTKTADVLNIAWRSVVKRPTP
jgi:hypothetical protein